MEADEGEGGAISFTSDDDPDDEDDAAAFDMRNW